QKRVVAAVAPFGVRKWVFQDGGSSSVPPVAGRFKRCDCILGFDGGGAVDSLRLRGIATHKDDDRRFLLSYLPFNELLSRASPLIAFAYRLDGSRIGKDQRLQCRPLSVGG